MTNRRKCDTICKQQFAGVAELADARDLKSRDTKVSYGFDSRFRHHIAEWSSLVARRAHNPKVGGSNPPSATKQSLDTHGIKALFLRFRISVYTVLEGSFLTVSCRLVSVKAQKHQKYIKSHHL